MVIIAESGASKTDWRAVSADGTISSLRTAGMNLASADPGFVSAVLSEAVSGLNPSGEEVKALHFYAAGLIATGDPVPENASGIDPVLRSAFPCASIEYASDLLGAARAVCGREAGVAVILGTGSNTCEYDGEKIVRNVRSGGFILGDEGSASRLGRLFVSDFLKGLVPEPVASDFAAAYDTDYQTIVRNVYKGDSPAGYLGSFAPFIAGYYGTCPYVRDLVRDNFLALFDRCLSGYGEAGRKIGVVGGFGAAMKDVFLEIAASKGVSVVAIEASPVEGLVRYHSQD